ncbi:hypothetical protein [Pyxidicoccus xibeiensis]|uniref:hypothetical protein n=1 Tax=Pyxidicoccus xibeiensis TaxID=2906759 RepID=UPI0020A75E83|nr:hypothetical protein [Pyxidicoccus xibeiensis]MCP3136063.1 hypothetical protein [Pyxidicoccus xibeiensis]
MTPIIFEESGFRVEAPVPAFRLADLPPYRLLSGKRLKEMDVGWWGPSQEGQQRLTLLELKGLEVWQTTPDNPATPREHLVRTCVEKATDTLLMLAGAWTPTSWGTELSRSLPTQALPYPGDKALKLVFLIDIPVGQRELLLPVRDEINGRLQGRLGIFGMRRVSVVDFEAAQKMGLPVTRL